MAGCKGAGTGCRGPLAACALCAAGFVALAAAVASGATGGVDLAVAHAVAAWRTPALTAAMRAVTGLGSWWALALAFAGTLVAGAVTRRRGLMAAAAALAAAALSSELVNHALKAAACRPRPDAALRLVEIGGYSFPSGHAMNAVAVYGLAAWLVWHAASATGAGATAGRRGRRGLGIAACSLLAVLITLIGFSRIYLGVHYLSDVLAGCCAGGVLLACAASLRCRLACRKRPPAGGDGPSR